MLTNRAKDLAIAARQQLNGPFADLIRSFLPQTWIIQTESGLLSLTMDSTGNVELKVNSDDSYDVLVIASTEELLKAQEQAATGSPPPAPIGKVQFGSDSGQIAYAFLRTRFGV